MSDTISISDLKMDECELSVDKRHYLFDSENTYSILELGIANARRGTWPWYSAITFSSREQWFKFVRLVNRENRRLKGADKDDDGFPIFEEGE
jgi:hypothetical protein